MPSRSGPHNFGVAHTYFGPVLGTRFQRCSSPLEGRSEQFDLMAILGDGRELLIDCPSGENFACQAVLEQAREEAAPLHIGVEGKRLRLVRRPRLGRVVSLQSADAGLIVEMTNSHARYVVRRSAAGFRETRAILRRAEHEGSAIALTDLDGVVDVRPADQCAAGLRNDAPAPPPAREELRAIGACPGQEPVPMAAARALFDAVAAAGSRFSNVATKTIPFIYPADGCWIRAHAAAEIIIRRFGVTPIKAWIRGNLVGCTQNDPRSRVSWGWNVATAVVVADGAQCEGTLFAVDPALFDRPARLDTWVRAQGDTAARLCLTTYDIYGYTAAGEPIRDPHFRHLAPSLLELRGDLLAQISTYGRGPYTRPPPAVGLGPAMAPGPALHIMAAAAGQPA